MDCTADDALQRFEGMPTGYLGRLKLYAAFAKGGRRKKPSEIVCELKEPLRADEDF